MQFFLCLKLPQKLQIRWCVLILCDDLKCGSHVTLNIFPFTRAQDVTLGVRKFAYSYFMLLVFLKGSCNIFVFMKIFIIDSIEMKILLEVKATT